IAVSDSGEGIKLDFLPRVFDRFSQADGSTTRSHGGLGLGLAIVRHLVELHGGTVRAESPGEGLGSTFVVRLPVMQTYDRKLQVASAQEDKPAISDASLVVHSPLLKGVAVLIVDDEVDFRELVTTMLGHCGANVKAAGSAAEALEYFASWKP